MNKPIETVFSGLIAALVTIASGTSAWAIELKVRPVLNLIEAHLSGSDAQLFFNALPVKSVRTPGHSDLFPVSMAPNALIVTRAVKSPGFSIASNSSAVSCAETYSRDGKKRVAVDCDLTFYESVGDTSGGAYIFRNSLEDQSGKASLLFKNLLAAGESEQVFRMPDGTPISSLISLANQDGKVSLDCVKEYSSADFQETGIFCGPRFNLNK